MTWEKVNRAVSGFFKVLVVLMVLLGVFLFMQVRNESNQARQAAIAAVHSAEVAQEKAGIRTCKALEQLNHVGDGITFSAPTKTGTAELYVIRLNKALKDVVASTGCNKITSKK